ncbi:MAG TPA: hypothetical protein VMF10_02490 [Candidatus Aquilonibacter sp.]|nr:hypothetical protein [Candidatus Aquilonibacter sp.]
MQEKGFFGRRVEASFFSKPPLRSPYFWANTTMMLALFGMVGIIMVRVGERLNSLSKVWLILCLVPLAMLWDRARRSHQTIHEAYGGIIGTGQVENDPARNALTGAANMFFFGFHLALWAAFAVMMSVVELIAPTQR